jgi:phosphatidate cytidylyltransferase
MAGDLRTRAILAPTMLLLIGGIYWLDFERVLLDKQGALSAAVLTVLGLMGLFEYVAMMRAGGFHVSRKPLLLAAAALHGLAFPMGWQEVDRELYPVVAMTMLMFVPVALHSLTRKHMQLGLEEQGATLVGFILISWPMYFGQGICFRHLPSLLFVVLVCKGGDIGGYLFGRMFGRHKLIPHVSPGKTIEGALGSLLTSVGLCFALRETLVGSLGLTVLETVVVGVVLNFTTQTGDLVESLLKRRCGAKDSSHLLPAHGGVLDLIDSLLFSFTAWFLVLVYKT